MNEQEIQQHRDACIDAIEREDIDFISDVLEKRPELRKQSRFVLQQVADEALENDNLAALRLFEQEIRQDRFR